MRCHIGDIAQTMVVKALLHVKGIQEGEHDEQSTERNVSDFYVSRNSQKRSYLRTSTWYLQSSFHSGQCSFDRASRIV